MATLDSKLKLNVLAAEFVPMASESPRSVKSGNSSNSSNKNNNNNSNSTNSSDSSKNKCNSMTNEMKLRLSPIQETKSPGITIIEPSSMSRNSINTIHHPTTDTLSNLIFQNKQHNNRHNNRHSNINSNNQHSTIDTFTFDKNKQFYPKVRQRVSNSQSNLQSNLQSTNTKMSKKLEKLIADSHEGASNALVPFTLENGQTICLPRESAKSLNSRRVNKIAKAVADSRQPQNQLNENNSSNIESTNEKKGYSKEFLIQAREIILAHHRKNKNGSNEPLNVPPEFAWLFQELQKMNYMAKIAKQKKQNGKNKIGNSEKQSESCHNDERKSGIGSDMVNSSESTDNGNKNNCNDTNDSNKSNKSNSIEDDSNGTNNEGNGERSNESNNESSNENESNMARKVKEEEEGSKVLGEEMGNETIGNDIVCNKEGKEKEGAPKSKLIESKVFGACKKVSEMEMNGMIAAQSNMKKSHSSRSLPLLHLATITEESEDTNDEDPIYLSDFRSKSADEELMVNTRKWDTNDIVMDIVKRHSKNEKHEKKKVKTTTERSPVKKKHTMLSPFMTVTVNKGSLKELRIENQKKKSGVSPRNSGNEANASNSQQGQAVGAQMPQVVSQNQGPGGGSQGFVPYCVSQSQPMCAPPSRALSDMQSMLNLPQTMNVPYEDPSFVLGNLDGMLAAGVHPSLAYGAMFQNFGMHGAMMGNGTMQAPFGAMGNFGMLNGVNGVNGMNNFNMMHGVNAMNGSNVAFVNHAMNHVNNVNNVSNVNTGLNGSVAMGSMNVLNASGNGNNIHSNHSSVENSDTHSVSSNPNSVPNQNSESENGKPYSKLLEEKVIVKTPRKNGKKTKIITKKYSNPSPTNIVPKTKKERNKYSVYDLQMWHQKFDGSREHGCFDGITQNLFEKGAFDRRINDLSIEYNVRPANVLNILQQKFGNSTGYFNNSGNNSSENLFDFGVPLRKEDGSEFNKFEKSEMISINRNIFETLGKELNLKESKTMMDKLSNLNLKYFCNFEFVARRLHDLLLRALSQLGRNVDKHKFDENHTRALNQLIERCVQFSIDLANVLPSKFLSNNCNEFDVYILNLVFKEALKKCKEIYCTNIISKDGVYSIVANFMLLCELSLYCNKNSHNNNNNNNEGNNDDFNNENRYYDGKNRHYRNVDKNKINNNLYNGRNREDIWYYPNKIHFYLMTMLNRFDYEAETALEYETNNSTNATMSENNLSLLWIWDTLNVILLLYGRDIEHFYNHGRHSCMNDIFQRINRFQSIYQKNTRIHTETLQQISNRIGYLKVFRNRLHWIPNYQDNDLRNNIFDFGSMAASCSQSPSEENEPQNQTDVNGKNDKNRPWLSIVRKLDEHNNTINNNNTNSSNNSNTNNNNNNKGWASDKKESICNEKDNGSNIKVDVNGEEDENGASTKRVRRRRTRKHKNKNKQNERNGNDEMGDGALSDDMECVSVVSAISGTKSRVSEPDFDSQDDLEYGSDNSDNSDNSDDTDDDGSKHKTSNNGIEIDGYARDTEEEYDSNSKKKSNKVRNENSKKKKAINKSKKKNKTKNRNNNNNNNKNNNNSNKSDVSKISNSSKSSNKTESKDKMDKNEVSKKKKKNANKSKKKDKRQKREKKQKAKKEEIDRLLQEFSVNIRNKESNDHDSDDSSNDNENENEQESSNKNNSNDNESCEDGNEDSNQDSSNEASEKKENLGIVNEEENGCYNDSDDLMIDETSNDEEIESHVWIDASDVADENGATQQDLFYEYMLAEHEPYEDYSDFVVARTNADEINEADSIGIGKNKDESGSQGDGSKTKKKKKSDKKTKKKKRKGCLNVNEKSQDNEIKFSSKEFCCSFDDLECDDYDYDDDNDNDNEDEMDIGKYDTQSIFTSVNDDDNEHDDDNNNNNNNNSLLTAFKQKKRKPTWTWHKKSEKDNKQLSKFVKSVKSKKDDKGKGEPKLAANILNNMQTEFVDSDDCICVSISECDSSDSDSSDFDPLGNCKVWQKQSITEGVIDRLIKLSEETESSSSDADVNVFECQNDNSDDNSENEDNDNIRHRIENRIEKRMENRIEIENSKNENEIDNSEGKGKDLNDLIDEKMGQELTHDNVAILNSIPSIPSIRSASEEKSKSEVSSLEGFEVTFEMSPEDCEKGEECNDNSDTRVCQVTPRTKEIVKLSSKSRSRSMCVKSISSSSRKNSGSRSNVQIDWKRTSKDASSKQGSNSIAIEFEFHQTVESVETVDCSSSHVSQESDASHESVNSMNSVNSINSTSMASIASNHVCEMGLHNDEGSVSRLCEAKGIDHRIKENIMSFVDNGNLNDICNCLQGKDGCSINLSCMKWKLILCGIELILMGNDNNSCNNNDHFCTLRGSNSNSHSNSNLNVNSNVNTNTNGNGNDNRLYEMTMNEIQRLFRRLRLQSGESGLSEQDFKNCLSNMTEIMERHCLLNCFMIFKFAIIFGDWVMEDIIKLEYIVDCLMQQNFSKTCDLVFNILRYIRAKQPSKQRLLKLIENSKIDFEMLLPKCLKNNHQIVSSMYEQLGLD